VSVPGPMPMPVNSKKSKRDGMGAVHGGRKGSGRCNWGGGRGAGRGHASALSRNGQTLLKIYPHFISTVSPQHCAY
jgi:hypothetical protein